MSIVKDFLFELGMAMREDVRQRMNADPYLDEHKVERWVAEDYALAVARLVRKELEETAA